MMASPIGTPTSNLGQPRTESASDTAVATRVNLGHQPDARATSSAAVLGYASLAA